MYGLQYKLPDTNLAPLETTCILAVKVRSFLTSVIILLSFQFKRSTIFVDVAQSKNTIPIMSESATRPNPVSDQLG